MSFVNTTHKSIVQSITNFQTDLINNPYPLFNDSKASIVDYFNLNITQSTLDEALRIPYANLGTDSPLRFNFIEDFYLYGLDRATVSFESGDFGLESSDITGEIYILPNTIRPYPGDYFLLKYLKKKYLFKITEVSPDTFDNGANYWRAAYKLDQPDADKLYPLVVDKFNFCTGTVGSNFKSVVKSTTFDLASKLDSIAVTLKKYYKSLYYNDKVQTYTFVHMYFVCAQKMSSTNFYDPYLIEFIRKFKVLHNDGDKCEYISHKTYLKPEFAIRYTKTIWRAFELRDRDNIDKYRIVSHADYIDDPATIFKTRYEDYFEMNYISRQDDRDPHIPVQVISNEVIDKIKSGELYDKTDPNAKYNIIIKYFKGETPDADDLMTVSNIEDSDMDEINFFLIPMTIYCIEYYIRKLFTET